MLEVEGAPFDLALQEQVFPLVVARPLEIHDPVDALQVAGDPLDPVGDLGSDRLQIVAARLLEVRELGDLLPVEPDLPAEPPRAEGRRLPVVLHEAHVVLLEVDPEVPEAVQVDLQHVFRRGLEDDLVLVEELEAVWIFPVPSVLRPARRLDVGGPPRLRSQDAEEGRRVERAGADLAAVRLKERAAAIRPELLEPEQGLLEGPQGLGPFRRAHRPFRRAHRPFRRAHRPLPRADRLFRRAHRALLA